MKDDDGSLIEILKSLRASKVEKKAFVFGVQVGDTFRSHDLFSELEDLMVGKGVVKRDETGHGLGGFEGEDAERGWA